MKKLLEKQIKSKKIIIIKIKKKIIKDYLTLYLRGASFNILYNFNLSNIFSFLFLFMFVVEVVYFYVCS